MVRCRHHHLRCVPTRFSDFIKDKEVAHTTEVSSCQFSGIARYRNTKENNIKVCLADFVPLTAKVQFAGLSFKNSTYMLLVICHRRLKLETIQDEKSSSPESS